MGKYRVGEIIYDDTDIIINEGKTTTKVIVTNYGDRPVQVGSHYHFFECNFALDFDREKAFGLHLDIPAGTAVRFEPGEEKEVSLVPFSGRNVLIGFNGSTMGSAYDPDIKNRAIDRVKKMEDEAKSWRTK